MATRITFSTSVSYEFDNGAPKTIKAEIVAPSAVSAASQALRGARKAFRGSRPSSIVLVMEIGARTTVATGRPGFRPKGKRHGLSGDLHPVDVAILGVDPSL